MERAKAKITRSSGNVFKDLGFGREEAEHLVIRSELMIKIEKLLKARGLTQAEAAKIMRVSQPRVSDLLRGRLDLFSTDALIDMLARRARGRGSARCPSEARARARLLQLLVRRRGDSCDHHGASTPHLGQIVTPIPLNSIAYATIEGVARRFVRQQGRQCCDAP